jgi:hypothetical protein
MRTLGEDNHWGYSQCNFRLGGERRNVFEAVDVSERDGFWKLRRNGKVRGSLESLK